MDDSTIDICPICQYPIGVDRRCVNPRCGAVLDKGDWALSAVYGTEGLLPPDTPDAPWRLPEAPAESPSGGRFDYHSPLPLELKPEDGVHHVGSSMSCHVRIAGIVIDRAVSLHYHRPTGKWWAFDWCSVPGMVALNGERFRNRPLSDDDILSIAGVRLRFRSGVLHAEHGSGTGVVLTVSGLVDSRLSRSEPRHPLLDRVSFSVAGGEFVGILGPSGCGKSTLIKTIAGLSNPAEGDILFNGVSRAEASSKIRALTGYLPQDVNVSLHDDLTVAEEIRAYLATHKVHEPGDQSRVEDLLAEFRLEKTAKVGTLSGGQRRRTALLLAQLRNPAILLLDEPAAGLDRATETILMNDLRQLSVSGAKKTILCATHELANLHLFHRILAMSEGGIAYDGPPDDVFRALGIPDDAGDDRARLLYQALADPSKNENIVNALRKNKSRTLSPQAKTDIPDSSRAASWFSTFFGYLGRFRDSFLSFIQREDAPAPDRNLLSKACAAWRWVKRWLFNPPLVLFVWQPLLVAFCISVALKSKFSDDPTERQLIFFCAAIAAFWLGMGGSARCLVATRGNRSLERLEGVGRSAYLAAVSFATLAKGIAQGIALATFLALLPKWFGCQYPLKFMTPSAHCAFNACLVVVVWMGGFVGLALSALSATEAFAVAMVPNLAVFALFFSQPLMNFEGYHTTSKDADTSSGACFARALPAHFSHLAMWDWDSSDSQRVEERARDTKALAQTTFAWITLCFFISLAAQTAHEKNWRG